MKPIMSQRLSRRAPGVGRRARCLFRRGEAVVREEEVTVLWVRSAVRCEFHLLISSALRFHPRTPPLGLGSMKLIVWFSVTPLTTTATPGIADAAVAGFRPPIAGHCSKVMIEPDLKEITIRVSKEAAAAALDLGFQDWVIVFGARSVWGSDLPCNPFKHIRRSEHRRDVRDSGSIESVRTQLGSRRWVQKTRKPNEISPGKLLLVVLVGNVPLRIRVYDGNKKKGAEMEVLDVYEDVKRVDEEMQMLKVETQQRHMQDGGPR
ncbi:hypothetical protein E3N88_25053 [Mikania micrantha]|uniref:Uncharacterized protein n=1 Tax=Mikania micrantha TaxID=192012 RepID=A0A5N6N3N2_9ASTR|nr:hypothetical protein E3N88_25053 [Mikania micrantha]